MTFEHSKLVWGLFYINIFDVVDSSYHELDYGIFLIWIKLLMMIALCAESA